MSIESPNGASNEPAAPTSTGVVEWTLDAAIRQQERELEQAAADVATYTARAAQAGRGVVNATAALAELRAARIKLTQEA